MVGMRCCASAPENPRLTLGYILTPLPGCEDEAAASLPLHFSKMSKPHSSSPHGAERFRMRGEGQPRSKKEFANIPSFLFPRTSTVAQLGIWRRQPRRESEGRPPRRT